MWGWILLLASLLICKTQQSSARGNLGAELRTATLLNNANLAKLDNEVSLGNGRVRFPNELPVFAPTSSSVESELCRKHSLLFLQQLQQYEMWALLMYDATAKFPSGILQGNFNQFGDFDECLSINAALMDKSKRQGNSDIQQAIQGRYCLAAIDVKATTDEGDLREAVNRAESYGTSRSKIGDSNHISPRFTTINWGLCVPSSCSAKDVERALKDELSIYNDTAGVTFNVLVDDKACIDPDDLNFSSGNGTLLTMIFYLTFIGASSYATYRDYTTHPKKAIGKPGRLLMAFSWKRTTAELFKPGSEEISCIHGIKAIFAAMVFTLHKLLLLTFVKYHNRIQLAELTSKPWTIIFRSPTIHTDSFLLMSGVLLSYSMTGEILSHGRVCHQRRLISRLIRLTPPLLAVILFYGYISAELGSGPQWGPLVGKNAELCRENAWTNLLYIQNFFPAVEMCAPQTHQLALDMQLSLAAPILVYVLHRNELLGQIIVLGIYLTSSALRYIISYNNELSLIFYHGVSESNCHESADLLYLQAIHRAMPYVLGVAIGYYLRKHASELRKSLQGPVTTIGWTLATFLTFALIIIPAHMADRSYVYNAQEAALFTACLPICGHLALGWLITACYLGYGGRLNNLLSSKPLLVFSRMSYSVFLVQFLVFNHSVGIIRAPKSFSIHEVLDITEIITTLGFAFVITILFEIPMREVKAVLMEKSPSSKKGEERGGNDIGKEFIEDNEAQARLKLEGKELSRNVPEEEDKEQYNPSEEDNGRVMKNTKKFI